MAVVREVGTAQRVEDEVLAADDRSIERDVRKSRPDAGIDYRHDHVLAAETGRMERAHVRDAVVHLVSLWAHRRVENLSGVGDDVPGVLNRRRAAFPRKG